MHDEATLSGELSPWPTKSALVNICTSRGICIVEGHYSIRIEDCEHFVFQQYGGDLGEPVINATAESVAALTRIAKLISNALVEAKIKHRFEIYGCHDEMENYLHYDWPV